MELAAERINAGEQRLRIGWRGRDNLFERDEDLAIEAPTMLRRPLFQPQVERVGHSLDRQGRHEGLGKGVHNGTIMEPSELRRRDQVRRYLTKHLKQSRRASS